MWLSVQTLQADKHLNFHPNALSLFDLSQLGEPMSVSVSSSVERGQQLYAHRDVRIKRANVTPLA